jgi:hypothetical protein
LVRLLFLFLSTLDISAGEMSLPNERDLLNQVLKGSKHAAVRNRCRSALAE